MVFKLLAIPAEPDAEHQPTSAHGPISRRFGQSDGIVFATSDTIGPTSQIVLAVTHASAT